MPNLNQVMLIGHLGNEPKIIESKNQNGLKIASFTLATTEKGFQKKDGTRTEDQTEWHNIVLFGKLAEIAEKYLHKGSAVFIQGRLKTRSYEKEGQKRYMTEIIGDVMQMLSKGEKSQESQSASPQNVSDNNSSVQKSGIPIATLMDEWNKSEIKVDDDVPF